MNSLVQRFSTTGALSELKKTQKLVEDGESSDAMWGSEAGFANMAHGVPAFAVPAVPDARFFAISFRDLLG
jgi:20S proteasome subunit beta 5